MLVKTLPGREFLMRADGGYLAVIQNDNLIGFLGRRYPMRNNNRR